MGNADFWKNKTVLVTGHTGFKGSWLCIWLHMLGAKMVGYALDPYSDRDNYVAAGVDKLMLADVRGDIRNRDLLNATFEKYQPEVVFHLAAQPIVLTSYEDPYETYEINVMGTMNVLEEVRNVASVRQAVFITTDKCYENKETLNGYRETDPFGGYDPYSSSKACDEILISSYRNSFFPMERFDEHGKAIASVRAGNVIGGGDWSAHRILPDCIRALEKDEPIAIRNGYAIRPWQHVLEPLSGYILVAEKLAEDVNAFSGGWNFGPNEDSIWTVRDVAEKVIEEYGKGSLTDGTAPNAVHEAGKLLLNIDKAKTQLGWFPKLSVEQAVVWTVEWYRQSLNNKSMLDICQKQIEDYMLG